MHCTALQYTGSFALYCIALHSAHGVFKPLTVSVQCDTDWNTDRWCKVRICIEQGWYLETLTENKPIVSFINFPKMSTKGTQRDSTDTSTILVRPCLVVLDSPANDRLYPGYLYRPSYCHYLWRLLLHQCISLYFWPSTVFLVHLGLYSVPCTECTIDCICIEYSYNTASSSGWGRNNNS